MFLVLLRLLYFLPKASSGVIGIKSPKQPQLPESNNFVDKMNTKYRYHKKIKEQLIFSNNY